MNENNSTQLVEKLAGEARYAARTLSHSPYETRVKALHLISEQLILDLPEILQANERDMQEAVSQNMPTAMQDRLLLNENRIKSIAQAVLKVAALPDPLGIVLRSRKLENGLDLQQLTVPFGVVGMVYEARPNVTIDAAIILLMSGNAALLRGSASAANSNEILVKVMKRALAKSDISPEVIQLIPSNDRETVTALLHARGKVDLVIPRGSANLIRTVVDEAKVPTIETGAGVCHVYVDSEADLSIALPILINSKTHRPSVCNAAETLLVHQEISEQFLPVALKELNNAKVKINGDESTLKVGKELGIEINAATEANYFTEYNALEINVKVVPDLISAIDHIAKYGTKHTESIITQSKKNADQFIALSDCAAVMVNASTRFTDGEEMGFGAEIGISNQKLHARGPMGLEQMTTTTWVVRGNGQIRI